LLRLAVSKGIADDDIESEILTLVAGAKTLVAEYRHWHEAAVRGMRKLLHFVREQD
jgi:hypothetical protein